MPTAAEAPSFAGDSEAAMGAQAFPVRLEELLQLCASLRESYDGSPESKAALAECIADLKRRNEIIESDELNHFSLGMEDTGAYLDHVKQEVAKAQAENLGLSQEVNILTRRFDEGLRQFQSELAHLSGLLEHGAPKETGEVSFGNLINRFNEEDSVQRQENYNFEILALEDLIGRRKIELDCIADLEVMLKRIEEVRQIQDILCDTKVIDFKDNCIRLSMRTFLSMSKVPAYQFSVDNTSEPSVIDHELLVHGSFETEEFVNVEIFPNDVHIKDIVNDAKSMRKCIRASLSFDRRFPLEWIVRKVHQRILLHTLRKLVVKDSNRSRHKFEYSSSDGTISAHLVGGLVASIMLPESWPISHSALKVHLLKNSDLHSVEVSVWSLSKVEELANLLDIETRHNLLHFVEAIEELLQKQMHLDQV